LSSKTIGCAGRTAVTRAGYLRFQDDAVGDILLLYSIPINVRSVWESNAKSVPGPSMGITKFPTL
jgi:hypothetical protein